jgi:hypothetical protein
MQSAQEELVVSPGPVEKKRKVSHRVKTQSTWNQTDTAMTGLSNEEGIKLTQTVGTTKAHDMMRQFLVDEGYETVQTIDKALAKYMTDTSLQVTIFFFAYTSRKNREASLL